MRPVPDEESVTPVKWHPRSFRGYQTARHGQELCSAVHAGVMLRGCSAGLSDLASIAEVCAQQVGLSELRENFFFRFLDCRRVALLSPKEYSSSQAESMSPKGAIWGPESPWSCCVRSRLSRSGARFNETHIERQQARWRRAAPQLTCSALIKKRSRLDVVRRPSERREILREKSRRDSRSFVCSTTFKNGRSSHGTTRALSHQIGPTDASNRLYVECMTDEMEYSAFVYATRVKKVCPDDLAYLHATLRYRKSQRGRHRLHASPRPCRTVVEKTSTCLWSVCSSFLSGLRTHIECVSSLFFEEFLRYICPSLLLTLYGSSFDCSSRITPSSSLASGILLVLMTIICTVDLFRQSGRRAVWPLAQPYHITV
ncbi:hypothetical protein U1Q18_044815 [Sarracenia purpurea var. burkii]